MMECPSCGKPTINASTRLIIDTCGHTKCRLCLLQEESGCTICNSRNLEQTASLQATIGSFDYLQPSVPMPTHVSLDSPIKLPVNELPQVIECLDEPFNVKYVIDNTNDKIYKETSSENEKYYEENNKQIYNEARQNVHLAFESTENILSHNGLSVQNELTITNNIINKNIHRKDEEIQTEQSNENSDEQTESVKSSVINTVNKEVATNQSNVTFVLLIDSNSPTRNDSESTVQITNINENEDENEDNNLPHKTPNQLVMYKSPEFRMSDYLLFNKQGESIDLNLFITSPAQSLGSRSPEFRMSDCLLFHRRGDKVYSQLIASPAQPFGSSSPGFRSPDYVLVHKSGDVENDHQLILSPAHSTGYKSPEFRLSDYLIIKNRSDKTTARLIASPIESFDNRVSGSSTVQSNENKTGDFLNKDDEDKENKNNSIKEDTGSDDVIGDDEKKNREKGDIQTKSKKTKKSDTLSSTRKSTRKRKLTAAAKDLEDEVMQNTDVKRRKKNTDWSHIVKLPGNPVSYECTKCKRSFRNFQSKSYHVACILGESPFCCEICGRTFKKRSHFEYHETTHSGKKPFMCQNCQKGFATKSKLDRHMLSHKPQNEFECAECGKKLSTKDNLKTHLALHRNPSFKCQHCPKTFTLKINRKRHEQYCFPNNNRYTCDICSKVFRKDYLLGQHKRRLHRKGKPYSCKVCKRIFLSKSEVARHETIHSDVKAFYCELCDIKFRRKDNLKRHENNHHSSPYEEGYGNVTPISVKEYAAAPSPIPKGRKRQAVDSPELSPKPKRTPKKVKSMDTPSKLKAASSGDVSNAVPVIRGPISIKFPDGSGNITKKLTESLSLEAAIVLNQQIEQRVHAQNSFCNFPGLSRGNSSPVSSSTRRRDSCNNNLNFNDGGSPTSNEAQDRSKQKSREEEFSMQHWRRRTAEFLKSKKKS
ncbi:hypothetical protein TSAR_011932 [Trichomalopsis sarcophagae]|uniref:Protein krueppel n=1 Tax=Trichomalopsis sarcophagae TaxID=543379 RepID=A0A232F7L1_9HYME|nr:hypothetical protein TSAR_011932 [Trichomalopsis sarcophagae]